MSKPTNPLRDLPPPRPSSRRSRRRRSGGSRLPAALAILAVVLLAGFGWWWFRMRTPDEASAPATFATADTAASDSVSLLDPVEPLDLPELAESDGFIRDLVQGLTAHPRWAEWLVTDRLAERFATTVASVAAGSSPREQLPFLVPGDAFAVRDESGRLLVDPSAYRRYDLLTETFTSLDRRGAVRLYRQLHPLFEEQYAELGLPPESFDRDVARAIDNLLAVQVPTGELEVVQGVETYVYADADLEARTPAEKHVLRLGPQNALRVQAKLREIRAALIANGAIPG